MILTKNRKDTFNKEALLLCILPSLAVLFALLAVTAWTWLNAKQDYSKEQDRVLSSNTQKIQTLLLDRLSAYEDMLRGGAGLFKTDPDVTQQKWSDYIGTYEIASRYPGVQAIGYGEVVNKQYRSTYVQKIQENGMPDFSVFPESTNEIIVPLSLLEPVNDSNNTAFGYDVYSEPVRRKAIDQATKTNSAVMTSLVPPREGSIAPHTPSFVMYYPVRKNCTDLSTVNSCPVTGYTFAGFKVNNLINAVLATDDGFLENYIRIYDGSKETSDTVIYESGPFDAAQPTWDSKLSLFSRDWTLSVQASSGKIDGSIKDNSTFVLVVGILVSFGISTFIFMMLLKRSTKLRISKDKEVQMVKDELLSLAAHQLRTPATAVKQYVLMALEGYGGKLNKSQHALVKKAFENNERQLRTVNELLNVANADAGKLRLLTRNIDLVATIKDAIDEQIEHITDKEHTLITSLPSTPLHYNADQLYLGMAISNLISNAAKYTPEHGTIEVGLKVTSKSILLYVKDSGVGISQSDMNQLFKKFSRIDNPLSSQTIGSGLGLYLAKKITELHNGTIKVVSSKNGSTFTILLPRKHNVTKGEQ